MSDLTGKFAAFETLTEEQHASLMTLLGEISTTLGNVESALDIQINNAATNTRYLLSAIQANSPCAPCPTPSIVVPPIGTFPVPIDTDTCKRSQAILQMLAAVCEAFDNLMALNVVGAWTLISDVYSQIISTLGAGDTIPLPSFPEAVNIAGGYFNFAAARLFSGESLSGVFSTIRDAARDSIYGAGDPESAHTAYEAIIDGSAMSESAKFMLKSMAYNALWDYWLDDATDPALDGFSGTVCSVPPLTCFEFESVAWSSDFPASGYAIAGDFATFAAQNTLNTSSGEFTYTQDIIYAGDINMWTWEVLTGGTVRLQFRNSGPDTTFSIDEATPRVVADGQSAPFTEITGMFVFFSDAPFTLRLCSPD